MITEELGWMLYNLGMSVGFVIGFTIGLFIMGFILTLAKHHKEKKP